MLTPTAKQNALAIAKHWQLGTRHSVSELLERIARDRAIAVHPDEANYIAAARANLKAQFPDVSLEQVIEQLIHAIAVMDANQRENLTAIQVISKALEQPDAETDPQ